MIKVNLLRDVGGGSQTRTMSTFAAGTGVASTEVTAMRSGEFSTSNVDLSIKIIYLLIPVALTFAFRTYQVSEKQTQLTHLTGQLQELTETLHSYEPGLKDIEKFEEEKNKLNNQLNVIKQLSKERLKNVKSLDALQGIIPSKAWLTEMKILDDKIEMTGMATDDLVISDFMQDLTKSIYFTHVILEGSEEIKRDEGVVKQFKIKCNLENM